MLWNVLDKYCTRRGSCQIRKQIQVMIADFYLLKAHSTLITTGQTNKFTVFFFPSVLCLKHIDLHKSPAFIPVRTFSGTSVSNNQNCWGSWIWCRKAPFEGLMALWQTKPLIKKRVKEKDREERKLWADFCVFLAFAIQLWWQIR